MAFGMLRLATRPTTPLTRLLALGVFAGSLLTAGISAQAEQGPPPQNLTPEQKAKIEAARKKKQQLQQPQNSQQQNGQNNPKAAKGQQNPNAGGNNGQNGRKVFHKGRPPTYEKDAPPAGQNQQGRKIYHKGRPPTYENNGAPPAAQNSPPKKQPPPAYQPDPQHKAVNPAFPPPNNGTRRAVNPAFPPPNNGGAPRAVNPAFPPPAGAQPAQRATNPAYPSYNHPKSRRAAGTPPPNLNAIKQQRQRIESKRSNAVVIKEPDSRVIVKRNNRTIITHNEANRLRMVSPNAQVERRNGQNITVIQRPNNVAVYNVTDNNGQLIRRYRRGPDGREVDIIDNRRRKSKWQRNLAIGLGVGAGIVAGAAILNSMVDVPPPRVDVPRDKYIVDYDDADEDEVYEAFNAPPVDRIDRRYTLDEVRATRNLRERMRRVDLNDINFDTGSWEVDESQYHKLERVARAMSRVIDRNPNEVFMIEGYTDAVGSDDDNLTLSDRRAESVAVILTEEFNVPPENLTTQGYGEQYLKIDTDGPERANRRVAVRRITPLISQDYRR